jgi:hypothetical protein
MHVKRIAPAIVAIAALAVPAAASASVTVDPVTGIGFVGKGEVQTAFGWNNDVLQKNAFNVTFKSSQPVSQAVSSRAEQSGTESATQSMSEDTTCILTNGNGTKTFHRDGERSGSRSGVREGSRTGSRAGLKTGVINGVVNGDPRQTKGQNQFTGFNLKGWAEGSPVTSYGDPVWGEPTFGEYSFSGDYSFGALAWGDWVAEPGDNPADCLGGNPGVSALTDVITSGQITPGDVTPGSITYGETVSGEITYGPITLTYGLK